MKQGITTTCRVFILNFKTMIRIIKNTPNHIVFEKDNKQEPWFNNKCSDEELLKHSNRPNGTIKSVKWEDGKYTASLLNVYFKL